MSFNTPPLDKSFRSNIDIQYDKIKKLMNELDDLSDHFDSDIFTQDQVDQNNITLSSSDQNSKTIDNPESSFTMIINSEWGFIQDKDLYREKEKLLKYVVI